MLFNGERVCIEFTNLTILLKRRGPVTWSRGNGFEPLLFSVYLTVAQFIIVLAFGPAVGPNRSGRVGPNTKTNDQYLKKAPISTN